MDKNFDKYMKEAKGKDFLKLLKEGRDLLVRKDALLSNYNLTPAAFVREAVKNANTDDARLDALQKALEQGRHLEASNMVLRNAKKYVASPNVPRPSGDMRRLSFLAGPKFDLCVAELSSIGSNYFELFALACRIVATDHPECFGPVEDWDEYQKELADVKERYQAILPKIESSYTADDIIVDSVDAEGYARVSFRVSHGTVHLGPGCAERLLVWLRDNPSVKV